MTSTEKKSAARSQETEGAALSQKIKDWAKGNDWYRIDVQTNQLRLEQGIGQAIEAIVKDLDYHNQHIMSRHVFDCYGRLSEKCRLIDMICRAGCRNKEEMFDLDILTTKTIATATELAEVLEILTRTQEPRNTRTQENLDSGSGAGMTKNDEWITFAQAAELMAVSKPTLTRWANEGKITCNGKKTRLRKLNKVSVLLHKQAIEDEAVRQDVRELREDAKKYSN